MKIKLYSSGTCLLKFASIHENIISAKMYVLLESF